MLLRREDIPSLLILRGKSHMIAETYTIEQLQKILKLSDRTIFRLLKDGKITGFKIGREWRFQESDINAYIQAQRQEAERERIQV
jgi:excisionase family DNA binding protein